MRTPRRRRRPVSRAACSRQDRVPLPLIGAAGTRSSTLGAGGRMDRGRLEAFSDGVFAVAITLLALDLAVPVPGQEALGRQLVSHWPSFAAYGVSFLTIGIIWVNHHTLFRNFADVDRTMLFLNLLMLFFVVTIP